MSDRAKKVAAAENLLAQLSGRDLDGIMAAYAAEPTVHDPVGAEPKVGRDAVRAFYSAVVPLKPTCTLLGPVTVSGDYAAFQFKLELTIGDNQVEVYATEMLRFDDDLLVTEMIAVPDLEAAAEM